MNSISQIVSHGSSYGYQKKHSSLSMKRRTNVQGDSKAIDMQNNGPEVEVEQAKPSALVTDHRRTDLKEAFSIGASDKRIAIATDEVPRRTGMKPFDNTEGTDRKAHSNNSAQRSTSDDASSLLKKRMDSANDQCVMKKESSPTMLCNKSLPHESTSTFTMNSPPMSAKGARRLSLLSGSALGSPPVARHDSPGPSFVGSVGRSTPTRSMRKPQRMSLGYTSSPTSRTTISAGIDRDQLTKPQTPSTANTSIDSPTSIRSMSREGGLISFAEVSNTILPRKAEDGETIINQHRSLLERIAEKERCILEIKDHLQREEKELRILQEQWQSSAHRELNGSQQIHANTKKTATEPMITAPSLFSQEDRYEASGMSSTDRREGLGIGEEAADALKGLSAKLGFGPQINAFFDQLVSSDKEGSVDLMGNTSLDVVAEEETEEESNMQKASASNSVLKNRRANQRAPPTVGRSSNHSKRPSLFGSSLAALQKQVEQQLSGQPPDDQRSAKTEESTSSSETHGGWGLLQRHLKEARENASGLLAMAEAKLGQALTMDDLVNLEGPVVSAPTQRAKSSGIFSDENDKEKAALAELNWLNSLAGIRTTGNVDRAMASKLSPAMKPSSPLENIASECGEMNTVEGLSPTHLPSADIQKLNEVQKDVHGSQKDLGSSPVGFFDLLGSVWGTEKIPQAAAAAPTQTNREHSQHRMQKKTREAARMAVGQGYDARDSAKRRSSSDLAGERISSDQAIRPHKDETHLKSNGF